MSFSLLESFEIGSAQFSCIKKEKIYKYRSILYKGNSYLAHNPYLLNSSNVLSHDIEGSVILENIQILLEITDRLYSYSLNLKVILQNTIYFLLLL